MKIKIKDNLKKNHIKIIIQCSFMVLISFILNNIVIFKMPFGGSITMASSSPIILTSLLFGTKYGLYSGFIYSLIQIFSGFHPPPVKTVFSFAITIMLDYIIPYISLGLASLFVKKIKTPYTKAFLASLSVGLIRYVSSVISGVIIWTDLISIKLPVLEYSLIYNLIYILPDVIISSIISAIVYKNIIYLEI